MPAYFKNLSARHYGILVVVALVVIGLIWAAVNRTPQVSQTSVFMTPLVQNESFEVRITSTPGVITTGEAATVHFAISRDGQPVDIYEDQRMLHVILVSENHKDFLHTISDITEEGMGSYSVKHVFTQPGRYRIWMEIDHYAAPERHGEHADLIAFADVHIQEGMTAQLPGEVGLVPGQPTIELAQTSFAAGQPSMLRWSVRDEGNALLPLFSHEPAISVIVGPDLDFFWHGHAHSPTNGTDVEIPVVFPGAGEYLLWTETYAQIGQEFEPFQGQFALSVR